MYALATCLANVQRGTTEDEWGDATDNHTVVVSGAPAQILVTSRQVRWATESQPRTVQVVTGAMQSDVDVRTGDLLHDTTNNIVYAVDDVAQTNSLGIIPDLSLQLHRLT